MTSSAPSSTSTQRSGEGHLITASLADHAGRRVFTLTSPQETISLDDSGALNRWAAVGLVERHKLLLTSNGIVLDDHLIAYDDPNALSELERRVNRPQPITRPPASAAGKHSAPAAAPSAPDYAAAFNDSVRVTRDGFEFRVSYRTRFGEVKTDRLEAALDTFQNMRLLRPHMNVQKSGIRLVVTRWDGENFVEEHGIENLEHASPAEVEEIIRANVIGAAETNAIGGEHAPRSNRHSRRVVRVELARKPHDARYHLVHHYDDGRSEDGLLLVRANMPKLAAAGLFGPGVSVSTTAMSDRIVITRPRGPDGSGPAVTDVLPLSNDEEAARIAAIFNQCLKPVEADGAAVSLASLAPAPIQTEGLTPPQTQSLPVAPPPEPAADQASPPPSALAEADPAMVQAPVARPPFPPWAVNALSRAATMPPEQVDDELFAALSAAFECSPALNEHGFPRILVESLEADGTAAMLELVRTPHYLLCNHPRGYIRFGLETRLFLERLDEYIAFPAYALRGAVRMAGGRAIAFVISGELEEFIRSRSERAYHAQFASMLKRVEELSADDDLIWPLSPEEGLFQDLGRSAASYGLPVKGDTIVLDPNAGEFIGFKKISGHGIEFHDGDEFVRFTSSGVALSEADQERSFEVGDVLLGWALDDQGHVCAICRTPAGFTQFPETKLLRFLSEADANAQGARLNLLARLT